MPWRKRWDSSFLLLLSFLKIFHCVCVCIHIYIYMLLFQYIYIYIYIYIYCNKAYWVRSNYLGFTEWIFKRNIYIYIYIYRCVCVCVDGYECIYMYIYMLIFIGAYIYIYIYVCIKVNKFSYRLSSRVIQRLLFLIATTPMCNSFSCIAALHP